MLKPSPAELLADVAQALDETVLTTLARGPARNQVQAAIGIVRRCAEAVDAFGPVLHAECADLAASLRSIAAADLDLVPDRSAFDGAADAADVVLASSYPSVPDLIETALSLRHQLAELAVLAEQRRSEQLPAIRELFERMLDREDRLGLSPW
ncbi:MAG: hypothetical protein OEV40_26610 [Acidimicrobiia bacterium]|nr:hypothetical protein [Acidimicrobiia bacterium]